jgi:hypothetical protein
MPQVAAVGQPDAIAIFMRRTLIRTSAPIFTPLTPHAAVCAVGANEMTATIGLDIMDCSQA